MGLFDSLVKAAKEVVKETATSVTSAVSNASAAASCTIARPADLSGETTQNGSYTFELPANLWNMSSSAMEVDFRYNVAFDEDDADELEKANICIQNDFTAKPQDIMKEFKRTAVNGHPVIFECVTYRTEDRQLTGMPIPIKGKQSKVYRLNKGGQVKNLQLSIPNDCPADEAAYAKKAFELIAATLQIS